MKTVLITGARAPVALHWARLLYGAGHRVILADSPRFPMSRPTRCKSGYLRLPAPRGNIVAYARAVEAAVRDSGCDLIVPTCEEIFFLAAARDLHGAAIPLHAPPFAVLAKVHDKHSFSQIACGFGADPPKTTLLLDREDVRRLTGSSGDLVFKPVWSRFAERVLILPAREELQALRPTATDPWIAQEYLPGEELCCWALARQGVVVALQAYCPLYRAGRGASLAFAPVENDTIRSFIAGFAKQLGWTGQLSFDFRHDAAGRLSAIECNPRATSGLHFFGSDDGLTAALLDGAPAAPTLAGAMTLPLAMLIYGLPSALRQGAVGKWFRDFRAMSDISSWPGDRPLIGAQLLALAEIGLLAFSKGVGLKAAATADIEWNGEPLEPALATPSTLWGG
jgi:hypothetical protein